MKKKDIRTKIGNALTLALFEIQISPSSKIKKSVRLFTQDFSDLIKKELKLQAKQIRKEASKKSKNKTGKLA